MSDASNFYRTLEIPRGKHPEGGEKFYPSSEEIKENEKIKDGEKIKEAKERLAKQGKARNALEKIRILTPDGSSTAKDLEEAFKMLDQDLESLTSFLRVRGVDEKEIGRLNNEAKGENYHEKKTVHLEQQDIHESREKLEALEKQIGIKLPETRKRLEEQKHELDIRMYLEKSDEVSGRETGPAEKGKAEMGKRSIK